MTERNAKKILLQILQQAQDEATSPDPCDLGVLADRFLERWQPTTSEEDLVGALHVGGEFGEGPWYVRILADDVHHTTENAPANLDWTRNGQLVGIELLAPLRRDQLGDGAASVVDRIAGLCANTNRRHMAFWLSQVAVAVREGRKWPALEHVTDQPTTRNQLIEQAGHVGAFLSGARGVTVLKPWPEVAERLLTWMSERGWLADPEQPAALLSRLADLTETAGKLRSTEWLRTCATLPPDQWPPAPGYKGPMVPAAEVEELRAELEEHKAIAARDEASVNRARAERDLAVWLLAEQQWLLGSLLAVTIRHRDSLARQCARYFNREQAIAAERDALQARIDAALAKLDKVREDARELIELREAGAPIDPAPLSAVDDVERSVRAALQGDQPDEATIQRLLVTARAAAVPPELGALIRAPRQGNPRPGELWRVGRDQADIVWVRRVLEDGIADVIPLVLDVEQADEGTILVPASQTPLLGDTALMTFLRTHIHDGAFINRLGVLEIRDDVDEVMRAERVGRTPVGVRVGPPILDDADPRIEYRSAVRDRLSELSPSAWTTEAAVTPPDPSGRIVDHGPVQPFTDTDRGEQP